MRSHTGFLWVVGLSVAGSMPIAAQDMPMIDGVGAYNHSQVMRHRDRTDGKKKPEKRTSAPDPQKLGHDRFMALSPESRRALLALKPELDRRTRVDGAASANRWFESEVAAAERREGIRR